MKNKLNTVSDILIEYGAEAFKLKNLMEGIVQYRTCVPIHYGYEIYHIEIELFYQGGNCLEYDKLEDIIRDTPFIHSVNKIEICSNKAKNLYRKTFDFYQKEEKNKVSLN